jgi:diketogulonate reductase-like aldo/keto reductase
MAYDLQPLLPSPTLGGSVIPPLIYGTAEKTDFPLIVAALRAGYRAIDTACQPQYYHEDVVGDAIEVALAPVSQGGLGLDRKGLFVQTKFTTPAGQLQSSAPYEPLESPETKVRKCLAMSLAKMRIDYVDALLLHGPMATEKETLDIWRAMESVAKRNRISNLGISNVTIGQLELVWNHATQRPSVVQNRFWSHNLYDRDVREFCATNNVVYQAFWVLKANQFYLTAALLAGFQRERAHRENMCSSCSFYHWGRRA